MRRHFWPKITFPTTGTMILTLIFGSLLISLVIILPSVSKAQEGDPPPQKSASPLPPPPPPASQPKKPAYQPATFQDLDRASLRGNLQSQEAEPRFRISLGDSVMAIMDQLPATQKTSNAERTLISAGPVSRQSKVANPEGTDGWVFKGGETFESAFGPELFGLKCTYDNLVPDAPNWEILDGGADNLYRTWGSHDRNSYPNTGLQAAWPAAGGTDALDPNDSGYSDNLNSWMICGPFDFSNAAEVYVDFGLWLETELEADWLLFGASVDDMEYDIVDYWSGDSSEWLAESYFLTNYAGHSQVWFSWIFESDFSNPMPYEGPWIDEIEVWAYYPPQAETAGTLVQNGSFEDGGQDWFVSSGPATQQQRAPNDVIITQQTAVEGQSSAQMFANGNFNDFLYQTIDIPANTENMDLGFWFGIVTNETVQDSDWFCVSLTDTNATNPSLIVDLGCVDATFTTGEWQDVIYSLTADEVARAVAAGQVNLFFELYNRGSAQSGTSLWLDYVQLYAVGGSAATALDPNEINDEVDLGAGIDEATPINCGSTTSGTIGDVLDSYGDIDWFRVDNVPTGPLVIDIDAETKSPPSALDSIVSLYGTDGTALTFINENDDDGATYDSYLTHTVVTTNQSFYILVEPYDGYGSSDSYYDLKVTCNDTTSTPPSKPDTAAGNADTWTIMLYLNAEDAAFEDTLRQYIKDMEGVLGGKTSYTTITVLYDGPKSGDTIRYVLQPDGNYVDGVNRWKLNEQNVGDRDTLAAFLEWSMDRYPAENYYVAIDDHGHGVYGISWDKTNNNDELTPPEVYSALKEATNNGARKIDIVDSQACLMGMAEHAYDVSEWVEHVIFSEQINWELNTYPNFFANLQATDTPQQLGQHIVNTVNSLSNGAGRPHTVSLVDTSQMSRVKTALTDLGNALRQPASGQTEDDRRAAVDATRNKSQAFAADNDATNPKWADYIDLWDLADKAAADGLVDSGIAQAVKDAVDSAVLAEAHASGLVDGQFTWNHDNAHGLSVYFPATNTSRAFQDYVGGRLFKMTIEESGGQGWDEFLDWAVTNVDNGTGNGIGGEGRKPLRGARSLFPKRTSGLTTVYMPVIVK